MGGGDGGDRGSDSKYKVAAGLAATVDDVTAIVNFLAHTRTARVNEQAAGPAKWVGCKWGKISCIRPTPYKTQDRASHPTYSVGGAT